MLCVVGMSSLEIIVNRLKTFKKKTVKDIENVY